MIAFINCWIVHYFSNN